MDIPFGCYLFIFLHVGGLPSLKAELFQSGNSFKKGGLRNGAESPDAMRSRGGCPVQEMIRYRVGGLTDSVLETGLCS